LRDPLLETLRQSLRERAGERSANEQAENLRLIGAIESYDRAMKIEFGAAHDHLRLVGQDNFRRYLPVDWLRIRVHGDDTFFDLVARVAAAKAAGCRITVSVPEGQPHPAIKVLEGRLTESWAAAVEFVTETDEELAAVIRSGQTDRVRYAASARVPKVIWQAAAETGLCLVTEPVLAEGRIELLWYVQEQSVSFDYHRYGNLGVRAGEERAAVL
jgi:RHH-type proline utilization regulon transcriptional repressor/proline dehydrogenase/delta 1-pyrroline-5-carboxylate dehydrogenase